MGSSRRPVSARAPHPPRPQGLPQERQRRDGDDRQDDEREVLLDDRNVAEEEAREHADGDPERTADHVVRQEDAVSHRADTRHEGRERPDDRNEPREDDRFSSVFFVELFGLPEVLLLQVLHASAEGPQSDPLPDPVVHRIAEDRRERQAEEQQPDIQRAERGERSGREQERVPGQERRHDEAGLAEDDAEEDDVRERSVVADHFGKVPVEVQEDIHQLLDEVHRGSFDRAEINRKGPSAPIMGPCCASRTSSRKSSPTTRAWTRTCCAARTWSRRTSTATSFAPRASPTSSTRSPSPATSPT